ncbi:cell division protein ZapA [Mobilisporobacter senegalensis]|uniref:Cell division protein ZapA n=1 Tax=Mobilisporobacter senegalensis TaxID=1329262 RepID=A0A3N1XS15_9FIRM|nr:cell division protein ZapA [Mobilisporobacter senegalensis]ROR29426.1 cell division protein ZapA [Mobilisporobacter senegalensis]
MNTMTDIEVIINNKRFTLCGYESPEYLQRVASYINGKYLEFKTKESYSRLDDNLKNVLLEINIADDYFKALKKLKEKEEESDRKSTELFNMKHEVISSQTKLDSITQELLELKKEYNEAQKRIVKLETELEESKKHQQF